MIAGPLRLSIFDVDAMPRNHALCVAHEVSSPVQAATLGPWLAARSFWFDEDEPEG